MSSPTPWWVGTRAGFRWYWRWKSRARRGRPRISPEIRELILRLAEENHGWGAPKIHGELLKLGFDISERTVARYLRPIHHRGDPKRSWLTFLNNHREVIMALDFFTVPTITFQLLYCFFVIDHQRRKILHCNVTAHPTADWVIQQVRETFSGEEPYRYAILDHDAKFNAEMFAYGPEIGSVLVWQDLRARDGGCDNEQLPMARTLDPLQFVLMAMAGWMNERQQHVIEYLQEENRVLREQTGKRRLRFSDDQRLRLAVKAKVLAQKTHGAGHLGDA
ncbi:MAG: helix-turn-helix domain-containing protein [Acidobacteriaceae bacterium]|nr:helix-turn-helix domain-containing protein [Acidobacteriaceae bacterium]